MGFISVRSYLVVCWMGFIILLIFGCALHGFHRSVDILLCYRGFIVLLISGCALYGFYRVVDIWQCVGWFYRFVDI